MFQMYFVILIINVCVGVSQYIFLPVIRQLHDTIPINPRYIYVNNIFRYKNNDEC